MLIRNHTARTFIEFLDKYKRETITVDDFSQILNQINADYLENDYHHPRYCGFTLFNRPGQPLMYHTIVPECDMLYPTPSDSVSDPSDNILPFHDVLPSPRKTIRSPPPSRRTQKCISIDPATPLETPRDLLRLLDQYSPLDPETDYTVNLACLDNIRSELSELDAMIGMQSLKKSIVEQLLYFMLFEMASNAVRQGDFKHTVLSGPPGTGKTEIAKIIGRMYSKIGILKKHTFKKVTRGDLVAGYLGQTAIKTRNVIEDSLGGVLFFDEAYSLSSDGETDSFSKECVDTLCEALSDHKDDLMVIIAGYEAELERDFFSANPGLESRFIWRFKIEPYSSGELREIFVKKLLSAGWAFVSDTVAPIAWFEKHVKQFKHYGRDMEMLFFYVKIAHTKRVFALTSDHQKQISQEDLDIGLTMFLKNKKPENTIRKNVLESMYI